jgi:hypothetical protein
VKLAELNRLQLVWMPGHMGNDGNETADELARQGFSQPLIGPKPDLGISAKVARGVIRDWTSRKRGSVGSPYMGKCRLSAFLKKYPLQKELKNCST